MMDDEPLPQTLGCPTCFYKSLYADHAWKQNTKNKYTEIASEKGHLLKKTYLKP